MLKTVYYDGLKAVNFIPNLDVDSDVESPFGGLSLHSIIYHHRESSDCGHYTAAIKKNSVWYDIDDDHVSLVSNIKL